MAKKIVRRFLSAYIPLIFIAVFVLNIFVSINLREYYEKKIDERLQSSSYLIANHILINDIIQKDYVSIQNKINLLSKKLAFRITIIDFHGKVIADSAEDPRNMENHLDRPEIIESMTKEFGQAKRFSTTLRKNMKYFALKVSVQESAGGYIRLALPLTHVEHQLGVIYKAVFIGGIIALIITLIIGTVISRSISKPIQEMKSVATRIAKGDFNRKIHVKSKDELGALADALNQMSSELQSQMDSLTKMNKVRTDFIANVSHELKTPLTAIKGLVETLEDGAIDDNENAKKFITIIRKRTDSLQMIVDDLLSLTELETKPDSLEFKKTDIKEIIEEILLGFTSAVNQKQHNLNFNSSGQSHYALVDRIRFEQVLINIIDNAIKYTPLGGQINITLSETEDTITITVEDNGIGIDDKDIHRVFERFYRVDRARSREMGGTGLGLSIVKHIINQHKGKVSITSKPKMGTKVIIDFPKNV